MRTDVSALLQADPLHKEMATRVSTPTRHFDGRADTAVRTLRRVARHSVSRRMFPSEVEQQVGEGAEGEEAAWEVRDLLVFQAPGLFVGDVDRVQAGRKGRVDIRLW